MLEISDERLIEIIDKAVAIENEVFGDAMKDLIPFLPELNAEYTMAYCPSHTQAIICGITNLAVLWRSSYRTWLAKRAKMELIEARASSTHISVRYKNHAWTVDRYHDDVIHDLVAQKIQHCTSSRVEWQDMGNGVYSANVLAWVG